MDTEILTKFYSKHATPSRSGTMIDEFWGYKHGNPSDSINPEGIKSL